LRAYSGKQVVLCWILFIPLFRPLVATSKADALTPADLTRAVHDNLRNLGVDALDVVNLRVGGFSEPTESSIEEQVATLADLQREGLIRA
jgi:aryl-alcohol dehydrogenase-like predicted oxidoreductase